MRRESGELRCLLFLKFAVATYLPAETEVPPLELLLADSSLFISFFLLPSARFVRRVASVVTGRRWQLVCCTRRHTSIRPSRLSAVQLSYLFHGGPGCVPSRDGYVIDSVGSERSSISFQAEDGTLWCERH